jgi:bifunctional non-homologous end joining protein LigD
MLCGTGDLPRSLEGWCLEPKWDGVRAITVCHQGHLSLSSRLGNDVTAAYPELAGLPSRLGASAVLDGEVVTLDEAGRPSFERLQRRMHVRRPPDDLVAEVPVHLVVFDLLWLDGELLVPLAQEERRRRLEAFADVVTVTPLLAADDGPEALLADCKAIGIEGFVAKKADAPYTPGRRSPCWLKVKATCRRELVVGGWEAGGGSRTGRIGSLAVGWVDPGHAGAWPDGPCLRWAGQVGSGLSDALLTQLQPVVERFGVAGSPFLDAPRVPGVRWVQPLLVVEVAYREVTAAGTLRHPVLKGLRTDIAPATVGPGEGLGDG